MIKIKNNNDIKIIKAGGKKLREILVCLLDLSVSGVNLLDIEKRAQLLIKKAGGFPSFMTVDGYQWATCLCVNEEVVHGVPKNYILKPGDVITIDIGMQYQGFHTDTASSKMIGEKLDSTSEVKKFLNTGIYTLNKAINQARIGKRIGHISKTIEDNIKRHKYCVVESLVGHGIGKNLHEPPQIPGVLKGDIEYTPIMKEGMVLAIEVIYQKRKGNVITDKSDGWTMKTKNKSLSAVYEHTVIVTKNNPEIVTF